MPTLLSYPGVYIEEVPSGVRSITSVATSIAAFIGNFSRGPIGQPVRLLSAMDFDREFGGLRQDSLASYAIQHFFLNGGSQAWVVRTAAGTPVAASAEVTADSFDLTAVSEGVWGNNLKADVEVLAGSTTFHLTVREVVGDQNVAIERFLNLSLDSANKRSVVKVLANESRLVRAVPKGNSTLPAPSTLAVTLTDGSDGTLPDAAALTAALSAFDRVDLVNILCIPDTDRLGDQSATTVIAAATAYAQSRRAFYIIDIPNGDVQRDTIAEAETWLASGANPRHPNTAAYFPRPRIADPLDEFRLRTVPSSGILAGLYARTDGARGVWKAPAGLEATLLGVQDFELTMTDAENGVLNPLGLNCLRTFRLAGNVSWGSRTLRGADGLASEWKHIPVRRLALFLEESLYRGTQFAVFEPNDEPLWSQIRLNVGAFMQGLFVQGAFQGTTPRQAYVVKCDSETTTQADINRGVVNVLVGFAPLVPTEFVVVRIQQLAGQTQ
ncbi:tail protein [Bryobacterales bacterium F-183]|nr:tail protein [Bryobacterales bacterium F-183]